MAIYQEQVSKRLEDFLDNHVSYEDIGDAENGPKLTTEYNGPEWAMDLYSMTMDTNLYCYMFYWTNCMFDGE